MSLLCYGVNVYKEDTELETPGQPWAKRKERKGKEGEREKYREQIPSFEVPFHA